MPRIPFSPKVVAVAGPNLRYELIGSRGAQAHRHGACDGHRRHQPDLQGEDASRIRARPGVMARVRSVALNILRANGVQNISLALYANAVSFDQLLALGTQ